MNIKKCLNGEKYQEECNKYNIRSISREMHLQERKKSTLTIFDDKRCYINELKVYHGISVIKWL